MPSPVEEGEEVELGRELTQKERERSRARCPAVEGPSPAEAEAERRLRLPVGPALSPGAAQGAERP